jgi:hypothetical protein
VVADAPCAEDPIHTKTAYRVGSMLRAQLVALSCACMIAGACGGQPFSTAPPVSDGGPETTDAAGSADTGGTGELDATTRMDASALDAGADAPTDAPVVVVSQCAGAYGCIPAIPTGWTGPIALYAGSGARPVCGVGFQSAPVDQNDTLSVTPATCSCACGTPQGVQCGASAVTFSNETNGMAGCNLAPCFSTTLTPGKCTTIDALTACISVTGVAMTATASMPQGGSCAATPSTTLPPTPWGTNTRACAESAAVQATDCAAGSFCAPRPQSPFDATACIAKTGNVVCPATSYTVRHVYFGGLDDERACSACTCGPVVGASCANSGNIDLDVYASTNGTCDGGAISYALPASCDPVQEPADFLLRVTLASGSCTASAVAATGTATATQPTTYCCLP